MHLTKAGAVLGTPLYFAPEQCSGKAEVDVRADVYSLGATLFHTLVGRPPFEAANVIGLITKHVNEPAPRVRSLVPELTEAIDEIVAKCLQKNPGSRYQNAGDMLRDLERLLRGEPTSIVAHPQVPAGDAKDVLAFDFSWELKDPHPGNHGLMFRIQERLQSGDRPVCGRLLQRTKPERRQSAVRAIS